MIWNTQTIFWSCHAITAASQKAVVVYCSVGGRNSPVQNVPLDFCSRALEYLGPGDIAL